jgi:hypothetical protein
MLRPRTGGSADRPRPGQRLSGRHAQETVARTGLLRRALAAPCVTEIIRRGVPCYAFPVLTGVITASCG